MKVLIFLILICNTTFAASMKVMSFNTTCAICEKGNYDKYRYRKKWVLDTIKRANPDLISLQEVLLSHQLNWYKKRLKQYRVISYRKFFIFRYSDPALFIKKSRFDLSYWGGFWFGPRGGRFSLGWKKGFPRRAQYVHLTDKLTNKDFLFIGAHFDNKGVNKDKSAKMLVERMQRKALPTILAADTNLKPEHIGYSTLLDYFDDAFDIKEKLSFIKNSDTDKDDSCNVEKGLVFPACRVDHVMLSKDSYWRVSDWAIDQYKYGKNNKFTSDHRALIVDLEME